MSQIRRLAHVALAQLFLSLLFGLPEQFELCIHKQVLRDPTIRHALVDHVECHNRPEDDVAPLISDLVFPFYFVVGFVWSGVGC